MKRFAFILVITVALTTTLAAQSKPEQNFFPVAVWYAGGKSRPPMIEPITATSEKEWRVDLARIKSMGFNSVRTWVEWSTAEPRESEYHFENLDLLLRVADEEGLRVIVQIYADSAPEWVGRKFPEARYAAQDGQPIPSQSAPGYCFDNRGVRAAMLEFFQALAKHTAPRRAFYAYDLWSEPAALNWARIGYKAEPMFCYCPASIERFRQWLKGKYGSLEALNRAWHRTFSDWNQVEPPRYGTILTYTDFIDWRVYYACKLAEDLHARSLAVKQIDSQHLTTSHAPNPSPLVRTMADPYDPTDDFLMKDSVDYFGTSFYPRLTSPDRNWSLERRALSMDLTKAITSDRGFYVGELQGGRGIHGTIIGNEITASDLQLWTWGMLARGAKSISIYAYYQMNAGYESGGYGLMNLDGTPGVAAREISSVTGPISSNLDALASVKPAAAEVAIVFNPVTPLIGGFDETQSRTAMHQSVAGYHRMFFERNIPVEILSSRELTPDRLSRFKLVIVPYPLLLGDDEARLVKDYVRGGGKLFTEARAGWVNDRGEASSEVPGFGWAEMLGVHELAVEPAPEIAVQWEGETSTFSGAAIQERFELRTATPLAIAGSSEPIVVRNNFGKGEAMVIGTFAGLQNYRSPKSQNPLGNKLIDWAGVARPALKSNSFVEVQRLSGPTTQLYLLFNHSDKAAHAELSVDLPANVKRVRELITGEDVWQLPVSSSGSRTLPWSVDLPPSSVRVLRVDR